jgi:hypothetical protein
MQQVMETRDQQRAKNLEQMEGSKEEPEFNVGDIVLLKRFSKNVVRGVPGAMMPKNLGPYQVTRSLTGVCEIRHCVYGNIRSQHKKQLLHYVPNNWDYKMPPGWNVALEQFHESKLRTATDEASISPLDDTSHPELAAASSQQPPDGAQLAENPSQGQLQPSDDGEVQLSPATRGELSDPSTDFDGPQQLSQGSSEQLPQQLTDGPDRPSTVAPPPSLPGLSTAIARPLRSSMKRQTKMPERFKDYKM